MGGNLAKDCTDYTEFFSCVGPHAAHRPASASSAQRSEAFAYKFLKKVLDKSTLFP
jgi:hypothetical protein